MLDQKTSSEFKGGNCLLAASEQADRTPKGDILRFRVSPLVVAATLMAGCARSPGSQGLPDEDIQKIRELQSRFIAVCQRSAWVELPPFFTDDAALIHAHEPAVQGIDAIRAHYHALQLRAIEANAQPMVIEGSGSWAYLRGTTNGLFQVGASEPVQDRGAFIWVLRKQTDGGWKIAESLSVPLKSAESQ